MEAGAGAARGGGTGEVRRALQPNLVQLKVYFLPVVALATVAGCLSETHKDGGDTLWRERDGGGGGGLQEGMCLGEGQVEGGQKGRDMGAQTLLWCELWLQFGKMLTLDRGRGGGRVGGARVPVAPKGNRSPIGP